MKILILHGPNLNLLGTREPEIYGSNTSEKIVENLQKTFPDIEISYFQSNNESVLIDSIQEARNSYQGIVMNAGAFSHTSIAIADAIKSIKLPVIALHISNIYQREDFRHKDIIGEACKGAIVGLGIDGYPLAIECLLDLIKN